MAHKSKRRGGAAPPLELLLPRIERAAQEGRFKLALELARDLYKQAKADAHLDLLRRMTVRRGQQLLDQGFLKEAAVVFGNALEMGGGPEFLRDIAEKLAACGAVGQALPLLDAVPESEVRARMLAMAADAALRQGSKGRGTLPADQQAHFDLIVQAFAQAEAGQDEAARATLQGIGLQSPFLEWKLLLRGLLAYYQNDDPLALENWQRLDPERLPAKLAAPLRLGIDPAFAQAQNPATVKVLKQWQERLQGVPLLRPFQDLQAKLVDSEKLFQALARARELVPLLRRDHPALVKRWGDCFFWAIVDHGQPEDAEQYKRIFDAPPGDPHFNRLDALAAEHFGDMLYAHQAWQRFERSVANHPEAWPGQLGRRLRGLIWSHLAANAVEGEGDRKFDDYYHEKAQVLSPGAEKCFQKSLELAPDCLATHLSLMAYYFTKGDLSQAKKVTENALRHFPGDARVLQRLGMVCLGTHEYARAADAFQQALAHNPLDEKLQAALGLARLNLGGELADQKRLDQARAEYEAALAMMPRKLIVLAPWAIAELKAGNDSRAEELLAQARSIPDQRLALAYRLVIDGICAKLKPALKKKLAAELDAAYQQPASPGEVVALVEIASMPTMGETKVRGQKARDKKVLEFVGAQDFQAFGEAQLQTLANLPFFRASKVCERCIQAGQRRFSANPRFDIAHARLVLSGKNARRHIWDLRNNLDHIREKIDKLPAGKDKDKLRADLQDIEAQIQDLSGPGFAMMHLMSRILSAGAGPFSEENFDDFDEEDDDF